MTEKRDAPLHKIKYGRINGWIYRHGPEQSGDYQRETRGWIRNEEGIATVPADV